MYTQRHKIQSVRNQIIQLENGDRIDLRKVQVGKIKHQSRSEGSKYGARSAQYDGVTYQSTAEAKMAQQLNLRLRAKDIKSWERQMKISLDVNGYHIANYYIDFVIHHNDGMTEYIEIKGMILSTWQLKWKLFEALYADKPNVKLTVIKV